jgi:hypothetical protein
MHAEKIFKKVIQAQWLIPVILATQETKIDWEDHGSRTASAKKFRRPHLNRKGQVW